MYLFIYLFIYLLLIAGKEGRLECHFITRYIKKEKKYISVTQFSSNKHKNFMARRPPETARMILLQCKFAQRSKACLYAKIAIV